MERGLGLLAAEKYSTAFLNLSILSSVRDWRLENEKVPLLWRTFEVKIVHENAYGNTAMLHLWLLENILGHRI